MSKVHFTTLAVHMKQDACSVIQTMLQPLIMMAKRAYLLMMNMDVSSFKMTMRRAQNAGLGGSGTALSVGPGPIPLGLKEKVI